MVSQLHSGFARFPSHEARRHFEEKLLKSDAALKGHAYSSGSQPTIIFEALTESDYEKVKSAIEGLGRWFEDIQFEPITMPTTDGDRKL